MYQNINRLIVNVGLFVGSQKSTEYWKMYTKGHRPIVAAKPASTLG